MFIIEILKDTYDLFVEMAPYLLIGLIFVGLLNILVSKELLVRHVGKNNFLSLFKAALIGVPLPLCSCGVVPTSIFMANNGASRPSVVSFLISTPQTGIDSILATYGMMGWLFAIYRPIAAFIMGISGGLITGLFIKDKPQIKPEVINQSDECCSDGSCDTDDNKTNNSDNKFRKFYKYAFFDFLDDISVYFAIGLIIAGVITWAIPGDFFSNTLISSGILGMLVMIAVGIPMYVCATASIPIAVALMMKGFSPGLAFVFLAVGPATNAASFTVLTKVIGKRASFLYLISISVTAIIFGYILDWLFSILNLEPMSVLPHDHSHSTFITEEIQLILAGIFSIFLIMSLYRKLIKSKLKDKTKEDKSMTQIKIDGMSCNHCVANVKKAIEEVSGVKSADVNLEKGIAEIEGNFDLESVKNSVNSVGYKVID